jgi:hypothetical protein
MTGKGGGALGGEKASDPQLPAAAEQRQREPSHCGDKVEPQPGGHGARIVRTSERFNTSRSS